jgi:uncharacterized repeat protein (TIGR03803 family)
MRSCGYMATFVTALALAMVASTSAAYAGVPEKMLASFNGIVDNQAYGLSMDPAGNLWGVAILGGTGQCYALPNPTGCGIVFELTLVAGRWDFKVIYNFRGGTDGAFPAGSLMFDASGNVYGTTAGGGGSDWNCTYLGCGTVYKLEPEEGRYKETVIYRFLPTSFTNDGETPMGGVVADAAGNLYGTTSTGGTEDCSCGTLFELSPSESGGWIPKLIHRFGSQNNATDGGYPYSGLVFDREGNLYGTTEEGGSGTGTVFEFSPNAGGTWTESILHNFGVSPGDGNSPFGGVVFDAMGNLYGTTAWGGKNGFGTVFELSPAGGGLWTENILHSFTQNDGAVPADGVTFGPNGSLYGVTSQGGPFAGTTDGGGTAFELTPTSGGVWTETTLHSFGKGTDGSAPYVPLVIDSSGNLYGATLWGGNTVTGVCNAIPPGCGTVFKLTP